MSGLALEGRAVFEGKAQPVIRVGPGAVQQTAPEFCTEFGKFAVPLFQDAEEALYRAASCC
jgi:hypothetical protein